MTDTTKRTAIVTGGASGMGEATALRFSREGMNVAILDIDKAGADSVVEQINASGGSAIALKTDISDKAQIVAALAEVRSALGPITVLVNNAAVENFCAFADIEEDNWDRIMAVNLKGLYLLTQAVLPDMVAAGWGRIINVSAFGAQIGAAEMAHYTASKGGVISLTR